MKLRFLYSILLCCLVSTFRAVPAVSYSQSEDAITESKALAIIDSMDRAARKRNLAGLIGPLAEDVKIKMIVQDPKTAKEQVLNMNKEQYTYLVKQALRTRFTYQMERKNSQVKLYDDGTTAMVTSALYESFTVRRVTLRSVSSEVAFLSLREGKIVVTAYEARIRFY